MVTLGRAGQRGEEGGLVPAMVRVHDRVPQCCLPGGQGVGPCVGTAEMGISQHPGSRGCTAPLSQLGSAGAGRTGGLRGEGAARLPPSCSLNPLCCPVNRVSQAVPSSIIKFPFIPTKPSLLCLDRDICLCVPPCSWGRRWLAPRARPGGRWQRWQTLQSRQLLADLGRG